MGAFPAAIIMGFMNYVKFSGFASRAEYWYWYLFTVLGTLAAGVLDTLVFGRLAPSTSDYSYTTSAGDSISGSNDSLFWIHFSLFTLLFALVTLLPSLTVTVRRLHDAGYSGLSYFWSFVPVVGPFIVLYRLLQPTQHLARESYGY